MNDGYRQVSGIPHPSFHVILDVAECDMTPVAGKRSPPPEFCNFPGNLGKTIFQIPENFEKIGAFSLGRFQLKHGSELRAKTVPSNLS